MAISTVPAGPPVPGGTASICGATDDRTLSTDDRAGRLLPGGCTAWLFSDAGSCLLTAGHCVVAGIEVSEFAVADHVALTDQFRIRFIASDDAASDSTVEAAVDGVTLSDLGCASGPPEDLNGDGLVDVADFLILLAEWGPCADPCPPSCLGDIDRDCTVGVNDFLALLGAWST